MERAQKEVLIDYNITGFLLGGIFGTFEILILRSLYSFTSFFCFALDHIHKACTVLYVYTLSLSLAHLYALSI